MIVPLTFVDVFGKTHIVNAREIARFYPREWIKEGEETTRVGCAVELTSGGVVMLEGSVENAVASYFEEIDSVSTPVEIEEEEKKPCLKN